MYMIQYTIHNIPLLGPDLNDNLCDTLPKFPNESILLIKKILGLFFPNRLFINNSPIVDRESIINDFPCPIQGLFPHLLFLFLHQPISLIHYLISLFFT